MAKVNLNSLSAKERDGYGRIAAVLQELVRDDWDHVTLNGFVMGMCRSSMEDLVGAEEAAELDAEARRRIGWD